MKTYTIVQAFKVENSYKMLMSCIILHIASYHIPIFTSNETQSKTR